jgi:LCP family protein required for cell wall assembly
MPPARRPNPFAAAALSAIVPGAGQWYAGNRRRAKVFLLVSLLVVVPATAILFAMFSTLGTVSFLATAIRPFTDHPNLLGALLVINVALLVFRAVAVVDAFLAARGPRVRGSSATPMVAGLGFLLILTGYQHYWVGERNLALYDAFTHDYNADPGQVDIGDISTTTVPGGNPDTTTTAPLPDAFPREGRVNVLLLGADSGEGRESIRTDTMVVVSIDPDTGWTAMFSIPRNLRQVPLPPDHAASNWWGDGCPGCYPQLLNLLYADGLTRPDLWGGPNSGANAIKQTLGHLLGIDIHYYAMVDMVGFIAVVDAIGGIDIEVPVAVYADAYSYAPGEAETVLDIPAGLQHLDGRTALGYARSRAQGNDFDRMSRQRCVLQAIAAQTDPVTAIREFPTLVDVITENVFTDIPISAIPDFIRLLEKFEPDEVVSVRYMPDAPEFTGTETSYMAGWTEDRYPIPDREFIAARTAIALSLPPLQAIAELGLQDIEDVCSITP